MSRSFGAAGQASRIARSAHTYSENSSSLSDIADHMRRGQPSFKMDPSIACDGLPTSWWYPNYHADDYAETREQQQERQHHNQIAVQLCKSCPLKEQCIEWAITHDEYGIWGGTFEGTRRKIRKARGVPAPQQREFNT